MSIDWDKIEEIADGVRINKPSRYDLEVWLRSYGVEDLTGNKDALAQRLLMAKSKSKKSEEKRVRIVEPLDVSKLILKLAVGKKLTIEESCVIFEALQSANPETKKRLEKIIAAELK